ARPTPTDRHLIGSTSATSQSLPRLVSVTRRAGAAWLGGCPGASWVTRRITATLAADGPRASTPADTVAAWAVTLRWPSSALDLVYCSLNAAACSGTTMAVARSMASVGAAGLNDAMASAMPVAIFTTLWLSSVKSRSVFVQCV